MRARVRFTLAATTLVLGAALSPVSQAALADWGTEVSVGAGLAVGPAYQGASHYVAQPVYDLEGHVKTDNWGAFTLGVVRGARWDLPLPSPFGVALLMDYDYGRKERISALGSHDDTLRGMGDLGGSLEAGLELSYQMNPVQVYVKGMSATRERHYGGENLGRTAYVDVGLKRDYEINDQVTLLGNVFATWANGGYQRGYFGVTPEQASRTRFEAYHLGAGLKQFTARLAVNYQWSPSWSFQAGGEAYRLAGNTADSPLVDKALAGMAFMSARYRF
ncbi:MipA/OmpV family protein [Serratia marcescens]|uniref:MipA/OmpV family protein n=1 Tax=Serratia marcescens TaxID=615 RepID=UPI000DF9124D|nr:MipA/OmpV family protein [Serratia marcescens]MDK1711699.1 MipA/OmpV family protein [Serratia marcescens]SUJ35820.1 MltA-interacting protein MipA [Serratia marcescens]